MTRSRTSNNNFMKLPEVTFSIKLRPATPEQLEAGKRLFNRLVSRARAKDGVNRER